MILRQFHCAHAVKIVRRKIKFSGHSIIIFKADQKPSPVVLLEAAKLERAEASGLNKEELKYWQMSHQ